MLRRKRSTLPAPEQPMQWSRRSISWTSLSSHWVRARDSNRDVDLAVGRPIVPAHTGRGYRVPRYVVYVLGLWIEAPGRQPSLDGVILSAARGTRAKRRIS